LGPVLASAGAPTSNGPGAVLLPFWKEGLQTAVEAIKSDEARSQSLGFYAALATVFRTGQASAAPLQEEAVEIVPLGLVVPAALSVLSAQGATGEPGDCAKAYCEGAAAAILQGGPRTWVRTQDHEEARYALLSLQTCAVSNGQSFLSVAPKIMTVLAPRFTEAASPPLRMAALGILEEMSKIINIVRVSGNCSAQDSAVLQDLSNGILHAVSAAICAEPRSATLCQQGERLLETLKASGCKETGMVEQVLQGLKADKHSREDDSGSEDKDAVRINGHQIARKAG